jgi:ATP-binding cassette subfamily B protein
MTSHANEKSKGLSIIDLLRPHWKSLTLALFAVAGVTATDLLEPWPLKIVLDNLLQSKPLPGWLSGVVGRMGTDKLAVLNFAVLAVAVIAVVGALSSYLEKYLTSIACRWPSTTKKGPATSSAG